MTVDVGKTVDAAASTTKLVGELATAAASAGPIVITVFELLAPWIPGLGPILTDIQIAIPIIQKIAQYAPAVQQGLQNGKPTIEAIAGIGEAIFGPLSDLSQIFPGLAIAGVSIEEFLKANEFTPQDPRFDRASEF